MLYYISHAKLPSRKAHTIQQMRMCEAFVENGENVCFVHPSYGINKKTVSWEYLANYYGLESRFALQSVFSPSDSSPLIPDLVEGVSKTLSINNWLLRQILAGNIDSSDIVYTRFFYPTGMFAEWYNILPKNKRPILITEHHNKKDSPLADRIFDNVDGTVCLTKYLKDQMLAEDRGTDDTIMVAHDGVNLSPYESLTQSEAKKSLDLPENDKLVMYTGHLYPRKGVHILAETASQINGEVVIVGGYEEDIQNIKSGIELDENILFTGFIDPSNIHKYQIASDVLVAPYTDDAWMPSPLKLFEYMAANSPIVASRIPTIEEVLEHRENALLTPPGNSTELSRAINEILANEELSNKIKRNARKSVESYAWNSRAQKILKFTKTVGESR